jgi:hypothetical protein
LFTFHFRSFSTYEARNITSTFLMASYSHPWVSIAKRLLYIVCERQTRGWGAQGKSGESIDFCVYQQIALSPVERQNDKKGDFHA